MKKITALIAALVMACLFTPAAAHATASTSCSVSPNPLHPLEYGTLSAVGLPTTTTVALYTYVVYDGKTSSYGDVDITVNPDGTYSQVIEWEITGKIEYRFLDDVSGALLASCNVTLKGAGR